MNINNIYFTITCISIYKYSGFIAIQISKHVFCIEKDFKRCFLFAVHYKMRINLLATHYLELHIKNSTETRPEDSSSTKKYNKLKN